MFGKVGEKVMKISIVTVVFNNVKTIKVAMNKGLKLVTEDFNGVSYYYLQEPIIKMRVVGLSTRNLTSNFIVNKEILIACLENCIYANWFMVLSKYPKKLLGLLKR